uniref:Grass carp reovirus (GCRV)-induced gene 2p n=1 Tax=Sander lucioperca TaxID=283035 RepID=A0A8C9YKA0_SANLU
MSFSGWEVVDDGASFPGVELQPSQKPQNRGVYTMYHGTSVASARIIIANGFKQSSGGMLGRGVYVSHAKKGDHVVFKLHVRVGRVKRIDKDNHPMQFTWSTQGYDTAWVPPNCGLKAVRSGLEEDCVFDPKRIKTRITDKIKKLHLKRRKMDAASHSTLYRVCFVQGLNISYLSSTQCSSHDSFSSTYSQKKLQLIILPKPFLF